MKLYYKTDVIYITDIYGLQMPIGRNDVPFVSIRGEQLRECGKSRRSAFNRLEINRTTMNNTDLVVGPASLRA